MVNRQTLPVQPCPALPHKTLQKLQFSKWHPVAILWYVTLKIGPLTDFGFVLSSAVFGVRC